MDELIAEFTSLGCSSIKEATLCAQTYLELTEIKRYWNVTYKYNEQFRKLYCQGTKTKYGKIAIFIPVSANDHLSFEQMQQYLSMLTSEESVKIELLYLVMCTNDCTNVFYELGNGIGPRLETKPTKKEHAKHQLMRDKVLNKNIDILKEAAMCNFPVTLTKQQQQVGKKCFKKPQTVNKSMEQSEQVYTKSEQNFQDPKPSTSKQ